MKKRAAVFKVSLIAIMIAILCVALSACGLFDQLASIKEVSLYVADGLEYEEGTGYVSVLGTSFTLGVDWHNARVTSPEIQWYVSCGDKKEELSDKTKLLTYSFGREDIGKTFEFYATADGINPADKKGIEVTPVYAQLSEPKVSSSTHDVVQNRVQQNRLSSEGLKNVTLNAIWNKDCISPDYDVYVKWFVDGVAQSESSDTFTYDVSSITSDCTICMKVEIGYEYKGNKVSESTDVLLVFVSEFDLAQTVSIEPVLEGTSIKKVADGTYYKSRSVGGDDTVTFVSNLLPDSAKQNAECFWSVRNGENERKLDITTRSVDIDLALGKNVITASIDNVRSRQIIVYVLSYSFDEIPTDIKGAMTDKFVWKGNSYDKYISSQYDLNACVGNAISLHKIDTDYKMYVGRADWDNSDSFVKQCSVAMQQGNDESGSFSYSVSVKSKVATLTFNSKTKFGIPSGAYDNPDESHQAKVNLRYTEQSTKRTSLPVDEFEEEAEVYNSNDLYRAVSFGYKPIFAGDDAEKLQTLYNKARAVLFKYISSDMTEACKVAAIYDWIVYNVEYDHAVATLTSGGNTSGYNAFYLEGVFDDGRAVCDGKSKAFALLCGMEGIRALRITGEALTGDSYGGHAWNKVLVDADDDGVREWYVVDTTWGDAAVQTSSRVWDEYLTYSYFLRTDADIAKTHRSSVEQPEAKTVYNTYKNTYVYVGTQKVSLYVKTAAELNLLLAYSKANGGMCLSVYIEKGARGSENFGHLTPVRDGEYVIFASSSLID